MSFTESCFRSRGQQQAVNQRRQTNPKRAQAGKTKKKNRREARTGRQARTEAGKLYGYRGTVNSLEVIRWMAASFTKGLMRE